MVLLIIPLNASPSLSHIFQAAEAYLIGKLLMSTQARHFILNLHVNSTSSFVLLTCPFECCCCFDRFDGGYKFVRHPRKESDHYAKGYALSM